MRQKYLLNGLIGLTGALFAGAQFRPAEEPTAGPVLTAATAFVNGDVGEPASSAPDRGADGLGAEGLGAEVEAALGALASSVKRSSHPEALSSAFRSYFAYKAAHPESVKKPYLYYVDYGLPSTAPRGYVFDMERLAIIEGPFTVAHGRGSSKSRTGIPTRFSNAPGSAATSLGLYLAQETYGFSGKASGMFYRSIGLRLKGLSGDWNDNARARGVVAHGAPYVAKNGAGRSEGCPAMEQSLARNLLPKLANGGLVFLFAPNERWLSSDPWIAAATGAAGTLANEG